MKLRNYQQKAFDAFFKLWDRFRSLLIVLPTGCGKTVVFGAIALRALELLPPGICRSVMILAHREELIDQAADKVGKITGREVSIEMGPREAAPMFGSWTPVVVSSVQTQATGRMKKFSPDDFTLLIIDEAHHATSPTYRACVDHYLSNPNCRLLGVTATPDRADEIALRNVFDEVAFEYSVTDAIRDGWLVPVKQKLVTVESLDLSHVSTTAGDLNQGELAEVLEDERNLHGIVSPMLQICGGMRTIVFAATVKQAERIAEIVNRYADSREEPKAAWLCGKTPKEDRRDILRRFREGRVQFVVNVGVLTEGFDDAGVEAVVMARPTKSRALYAQMAGRATRPDAAIAALLGDCATAEERCALIRNSAKPCCLILDFVGNSGRHKLVTMVDILGGKDIDEDEEAARAEVRRKCLDAEEVENALDELEKARERIRAAKLEAERKRAYLKIAASFTATSVDPFNVYDVIRPDEQTRCALDRRHLSFKQKAVLRERIGVNPDRISTSDGYALLDENFRRRGLGLATMKQSRFLKNHGFPMPMTFEEAKRTITRIMAGEFGRRRA